MTIFPAVVVVSILSDIMRSAPAFTKAPMQNNKRMMPNHKGIAGANSAAIKAPTTTSAKHTRPVIATGGGGTTTAVDAGSIIALAQNGHMKILRPALSGALIVALHAGHATWIGMGLLEKRPGLISSHANLSDDHTKRQGNPPTSRCSQVPRGGAVPQETSGQIRGTVRRPCHNGVCV